MHKCFGSWLVTSSLVCRYQTFGGTYCLHLQCRSGFYFNFSLLIATVYTYVTNYYYYGENSFSMQHLQVLP
jgi:hypothetical protein